LLEQINGQKAIAAKPMNTKEKLEGFVEANVELSRCWNEIQAWDLKKW